MLLTAIHAEAGSFLRPSLKFRVILLVICLLPLIGVDMAVVNCVSNIYCEIDSHISWDPSGQYEFISYIL